MALHTDRIAGDAASQSLLLECSVWIVAIAATYQAFIHLMVERLRKGGLHVSVACIAELRLGDLEKAGLASGFMNAVATRTTYICGSVCGALKIRMRGGVALQALVIDLFRCRFGEPEECLQAAAASLYVLSAWSMAALAGSAFAPMQHRKARVWVLGELLADLTVTEFTGFRSNKVGPIGDTCLFIRASLLLIGSCLPRIGSRLLLTCSRSVRRHGFPEAEKRYDERQT
jgi:hypothetical protein